MTIASTDELSRCIIFDTAFAGEFHVDAKLLFFGKRDVNGVAHASGVLRRLAPMPEDVHRIGCGIAALQNARKNEPIPGDKRRYYCGFRTAPVAKIPLEGKGYKITLTLDNENGELAHVDIGLFVDSANRNERSTIAADAGLALAEAFGDAIEHICHCDRDDSFHPLVRWPNCLSVSDDELWG